MENWVERIGFTIGTALPTGIIWFMTKAITNKLISRAEKKFIISAILSLLIVLALVFVLNYMENIGYYIFTALMWIGYGYYTMKKDAIDIDDELTL